MSYPIIPTRALADVVAEREKQDARWGEQNYDDFTWFPILTEEVGEVAQAILHDRFGGKAAGTIRVELVHAAAVALAMIECIDRRKEAAQLRQYFGNVQIESSDDGGAL